MMGRLFLFSLCFCLASTVMGKTVRITDKLIVGLYQSETLKGKPMTLLRTDTPLEVLNTLDKVSLVKTTDGKTGWVESIYLTSKKSSSLQLIDLQIKYRKSQDNVKTAQLQSGKSNAKVSKLQKEVKFLKSKRALTDRSKELSTVKAKLRKARGQIAQLKSVKKRPEKDAPAAPQITQLEESIKTLEADLALEQQKNKTLTEQSIQTKPVSTISPISNLSSSEASAALQNENSVLRDKIQQIANIADVDGQPEFSWLKDMSIIWVIVILSSLLLLGFVAGILWLDMRQRKRHGGFRVL